MFPLNLPLLTIKQIFMEKFKLKGSFIVSAVQYHGNNVEELKSIADVRESHFGMLMLFSGNNPVRKIEFGDYIVKADFDTFVMSADDFIEKYEKI